jgi:valyl-tRNA synthetase
VPSTARVADTFGAIARRVGASFRRMSELPKAYDPSEVEPRWYQFWIDQGVFKAGVAETDDRPAYCLALPPPNVTGSLHMGHALGNTLQDVLTRHRRMQGYNALWQPGMDHAGIATQTVVERQLRREGTTRHDLGREAFVERIWEWKEARGERILEQMKQVGTSCDWDRLLFTMDPPLEEAVKEAFVRLHEEGLIYRATRLINWCHECRTALSDLEVENQESDGEMFEFAYEVIDASGEGTKELVVATTRPETMLGDTAVAVHPDDKRYAHLHGKKLRHPFVDREVPVITDDILVDMEFGTGAVKVTPAHDFNDFATGKRHSLEEINLLSEDGTLNDAAGSFKGQTVKESRKAIKQALDDAGLARGSKKHKLQLPRCQRCNTIVEPMISTQWFVKMEPLAKPALEAVKDGRIEILPAEWIKTYDHWLTNIQDWCVSRQLWWGHSIPAWFCQSGSCDHITVSRHDVTACEKCGGAVKQDDDVLDTWFSSSLWPFSTLGWPNETTALKRFYPNSDMETGYDILFFWVARMVMMGMHFMGDVPFKRVLLHGLVVDETGDKMSKVKGNTIDPLDLIHGAPFDTVVEKALPGAPHKEALKRFRKAYPSTAQMGEGFQAYGADALRMTLCSYSPQAKRIALSPKRIEGYRNFCNKMYNAVRFALTHVEGVELDGAQPKTTLLINRWVLSRLEQAIQASNAGIEAFRVDEGSGALYRFLWDEFCDWYLEMTKPIFQGDNEAEKAETRQVLAHTLETTLRAFHPYIPYITEELWQRVPRPASRPASIAVAQYPAPVASNIDAIAEAEMKALMGAISAARTVRSEHEVPPSARVPLVLRSKSPEILALLRRELGFIEALVRTDGAPTVEAHSDERPKGFVVAGAGDVEVLVGLRGHVDAAKEAERIERGLKKADKELIGLEKRLNNPKFLDKAPPEVVEEVRQQKLALLQRQERLREANALVAELE